MKKAVFVLMIVLVSAAFGVFMMAGTSIGYYTITVQTNTGNGTVEIDGTTYNNSQSAYLNGGTHTISAVPPPGYIFDHWAGNGVSNVTAQNTTLLVSANTTLEAYFINPATIKKYNVTVHTNVQGATVKIEGVQYSDGQIAQLRNGTYEIQAVPPEGYGFYYWSVNGLQIFGTGATANVTVSGQDGAIYAYFYIESNSTGSKNYIIELYTNVSGATIRVDGTTYNSGDAVEFGEGNHTVSAIAPEGWKFDHWTTVSTAVTDLYAANTTLQVSSNGTLEAYFTPVTSSGVQTYTVTFYTNVTGATITYGTATYQSGQSTELKANTVYSFTANPPAGWQLSNWSYPSAWKKIWEVNNSIQLNVTSNGTLAAYFVPAPQSSSSNETNSTNNSWGATNSGYKIIFHTNSDLIKINLNGTEFTDGQTTYLENGTYNVSISVPSGYLFDHWGVQNITISSTTANPATITVNGAGGELWAYIVAQQNTTAKTYNIVVQAPLSGEKIVINHIYYTNGETAQLPNGTYALSIVLPSGWSFVHWSPDNVSVADVNSTSTTLTVNGQSGIITAMLQQVQNTNNETDNSSSTGGAGLLDTSSTIEKLQAAWNFLKETHTIGNYTIANWMIVLALIFILYIIIKIRRR